MEEEAKPCPYCGAKAEISNSCGAWYAHCSDIDNCGNMGFVESEMTYYEDILKKWNTRTNSSSSTN